MQSQLGFQSSLPNARHMSFSSDSVHSKYYYYFFARFFLSVERIDFEIDSGQSRINFTINEIKTRGISVRSKTKPLIVFFLPFNDAADHSIWLWLMGTGYWLSGFWLRRMRTYFIIQDTSMLDYFKFAYKMLMGDSRECSLPTRTCI